MSLVHSNMLTSRWILREWVMSDFRSVTQRFLQPTMQPLSISQSSLIFKLTIEHEVESNKGVRRQADQLTHHELFEPKMPKR